MSTHEQEPDSRAPAPSLSDLLADEQWLALLARSLVSAPDVQDELVQEVRWVGLTSSSAPHVRHPTAWLRTVARSRLQNIVEKQRTRRHHEKRAGTAPASGSAPADGVALTETRRIVAAAVLSLPRRHRDTLLALYYEGLGVGELARCVGCTESAIRFRHKKALATLKSALLGRADDLGVQEPVLPERKAPRREPRRGHLIVLDARTRRPIPGAVLHTWDPEADADAMHRRRTTSQLEHLLLMNVEPVEAGRTDIDGRVAVALDVLRCHALRVARPGHATYQEPVRRRALEGPEWVVHLDPPQTATVHIRRGDGRPAAGVSFEVIAADSSRSQCTSDTDGVAQVRAHDVAAAVSIDDGHHVPLRRLLRVPDTRLTLEAGSRRRLVVVGFDGRPVAGCRLLLHLDSWAGWYDCGTTDERGRIQTPPLPAHDQYLLRAQHPRMAATQRTTALRGDAPTVLTLSRGAHVTGTVVDGNGRALASGGLTIVPPDGPRREPRSRHRITPSGRVDLGHLAPGTYDVLVSHGDLQEIVQVEVDGSRPRQELRLQLSPTSPVAGRLVDSRGEPAPGVSLRVGAIVGTDLVGPTTTTDDEGRFSFPEVPTRFPRTRAQESWDVRWWTALNAMGRLEPAALVLQVLPPHQLAAKGGETVQSCGLHGSLNTCMVFPGETDIELRLEAPSGSPPRFDLRDDQGRRVRTLTHVSFTTPDGYSHEEPAGMDGRPARIFRPDRVTNQVATILAEGYAWAHVLVTSTEGGAIVVGLEAPREQPLVLEFLDDTGTAAPGLQVFLSRVMDDRREASGVYIGDTDDRGRLATRAIVQTPYLVHAIEVLPDLARYLPRTQERPERCLWMRWAWFRERLEKRGKRLHTGVLEPWHLESGHATFRLGEGIRIRHLTQSVARLDYSERAP